MIFNEEDTLTEIKPVGPHKCCLNFAQAQERGTDNETYGSLIDYFDDDFASMYLMGSDLPALSYCPWCGAKIER